MRVVLVGLTVCQRNNHELVFELLNSCAFSQDSRHGFILLGLSDLQLLGILAVIEYLVPLESLASIADHPALDPDLVFLLLLNANSHEFRYFGTQGMINYVLLLQLCYLPDLISSQKCFLLVKRSENVANSFQLECTGNDIDSRSEWII